MSSCFDLTDRLVTLVQDEGSKLQTTERLDCCGTQADCRGCQESGSLGRTWDVVATERRRVPKAASKNQSWHLYLPVPGASQALCRHAPRDAGSPSFSTMALSGSGHKPKLCLSHLFL